MPDKVEAKCFEYKVQILPPLQARPLGAPTERQNS